MKSSWESMHVKLHISWAVANLIGLEHIRGIKTHYTRLCGGDGDRGGRKQRTGVYNVVVSLGSSENQLKQVTKNPTRHPGDFPTQTVIISKHTGVGIKSNTIHELFCFKLRYSNKLSKMEISFSVITHSKLL